MIQPWKLLVKREMLGNRVFYKKLLFGEILKHAAGLTIIRVNIDGI